MIISSRCLIDLGQGFSKFTFKGPNRNYHQRQKVRNNCYYKTCFYKHAYITIQLDICLIIIFMTSSGVLVFTKCTIVLYK